MFPPPSHAPFVFSHNSHIFASAQHLPPHKSIFSHICLHTALAAAECASCVGSKYPYNPYGCANCLSIGGANETIRQECFFCVQNDPYNGTASNYNW